MTPLLELLRPQPGEVYLDATAGLGGHAAAMAERVGPTGKVILCDLDAGNLSCAAERVRALPRAPTVFTLHTSFVQIPRLLAEHHPEVRVDMLLADLGFASNQMADAQRGFSFMHDGPLDMRLDRTGPITAAELVNTLPEEELAAIFRDLGEEPPGVARGIARKLVSARAVGPIETTSRFAAIVRSAVPAASYRGIDPATRSFQALRITVNDELGNLTGFLAAIERAAAAAVKGIGAQGGKMGGVGGVGGVGGWVRPNARIGIISFHSLEDRPVKQSFNKLVEERHIATHLTRKAVQADDGERAENPRSRSAKLRVIRLGAG